MLGKNKCWIHGRVVEFHRAPPLRPPQPNTSASRAISTKEDPTGAFYVLSSSSSAPRGRPSTTGDAVEMLGVTVVGVAGEEKAATMC